MPEENIKTVTRLSKTKRDRMAVFFDGEFDFSVDMETFVKDDIKVGKRYGEADYEDLRHLTQYTAAKTKAFGLLSYKSYTKELLRTRLRQDFEQDSVEEVLERVEELGLLDDMDYALRCSRDLVNIKRFSPARVKQELNWRGLGQEEIEAALSQFDEMDLHGQIAQVIKKKYSKNLSDEKGRRRAVNALARLGYGYGDINRVIENLLKEEDE